MQQAEMKLPGRDTVEAYISEGGFICLMQEGPLFEEPSIVMMLPQDIPQVIEWLQSLAKELPVSQKQGEGGQ